MMDQKKVSEATGVNPGDCYLTDNLVSNAGTVFQGFQATPLALIDLCQLIEASILHDHLVVGGVGSFSNRLGERLQKEDIMRHGSMVGPGGLWKKRGESPPNNLFLDIFETALDSIKRTGRFGRLFMSLPSDRDPDPGVRAVELFELATDLAAFREGIIEFEEDAAKKLEEAIGPILNNYAHYGRLVAEVSQRYEIPVFSGTTEQPILGQNALDLAIPDEANNLLLKAYGDHFRQHIGGIIDAVPAPPLAGIVLKDAKSINDIIDQLLRYRARFESFRKTVAKLREAKLEARRERTTAAAMEYRRMQKELELSLQRSIERIEKSVRPKRKLVFRIWDLVKLLDLKKMAIAGMDQVVEWAEQIDQSRTTEGVFEVVSYFPTIPSLDAISERLFQNQFRPRDLKKFTTGVKQLAACYGLNESEDYNDPNSNV